MADPFRSPKRRILRAKEHARDLEAKIKTFLDQEPWANVAEPDPDGVNTCHKIKFIEPLPDELSEVAVDALDNLGSALDEAGYATAVCSGRPSDSKRAYFPFADTPSDLENVIKGRCKDIPPEIVTLMRSFQPYKGGNDPLWALNKVRTSNQHKILTPIGVIVGAMNIAHIKMSGTGSLLFAQWNREKTRSYSLSPAPKLILVTSSISPLL